jgi:ERCC4-related helicase
MLKEITPEHDEKLQTLFSTIMDKLNNPINDNNRKILIFTAFADTAIYLFEHVSAFVKNNFGLDSAMVNRFD